MTKTIEKVNGVANQNQIDVLEQIQINLVDLLLNTGGLCIGSSAKAKVKIANTIYAMINGVLVTKASAEITFTAGDDTTNDKYNVYALTMDAAGSCTLTGGTEGATLGAVVFPTIPDDEVCLGFVIINPSGTGDFDAGTTELDDATVTPNAVYTNTPYPFNPNALSL